MERATRIADAVTDLHFSATNEEPAYPEDLVCDGPTCEELEREVCPSLPRIKEDFEKALEDVGRLLPESIAKKLTNDLYNSASYWAYDQEEFGFVMGKAVGKRLVKEGTGGEILH